MFDLVTGVSTGALTSPFAFLGSAYDPQLKDVCTSITLADVARSRGFIAALFDEALGDTAPLSGTTSHDLNEEMPAAIGRGHDEGGCFSSEPPISTRRSRSFGTSAPSRTADTPARSTSCARSRSPRPPRPARSRR